MGIGNLLGVMGLDVIAPLVAAFLRIGGRVAAHKNRRQRAALHRIFFMTVLMITPLRPADAGG